MIGMSLVSATIQIKIIPAGISSGTEEILRNA
jgi:hypothetical protein